MPFTKRDPVTMGILMFVTLGFYSFYWMAVTKDELNRQGAQIPTFFLFFIPIANIYFLYKFAEAFARYAAKDDTQTLLYFLLIVLLFPIGEIICQVKMNEAEGGIAKD